MISPVFIIPSHARADEQPTLDYLEKLGIQKSRIFMCVWDTELSDYDIVKPRVNKIFTTKVHNISGGRNVLLDSTAAFKYAVMMDDDITHIAYLKDGKLVPIQDGATFERFLNMGFGKCLQAGAKLWGIYPVYNAFFMSEKVRERAILIGTVLGIINEGMRFDLGHFVKGDYDLCCRSMKQYGKVLRFDNFGVKAKHYSKGGCAEFWHLNKKMCDRLMSHHSDLLKLNPKRPGEVLLK